MKIIQYIYIFILTVILFSSCVMSKKVNYLQEREDLPVYADTVTFTDYQLQRGDYLYIKVNTLDDETSMMLNGNIRITGASQMTADNSVARLYLYLVAEDDCIDYPYVGKVPVVGKNLREVKVLLEQKLSEMITGFSVEVRLANRTFSVIGESGSGRYTIPREKTTIFEALAMSGDLSIYAKRNHIQLIRQTSDGTVVKTFDLRTRSIIDSEYYYIQPNDVIYVPFQNAKYWGASHVTGVLSISFTTISFGMLIYSIVDKIIKTTKPQE